MKLRLFILAVTVTALSLPPAVRGAYVRVPDADDTYIRDFGVYVDYNYGTATNLECGSDKVGGKLHKSRMLVKFPFAADSIPVGATIDSAKVRLSCTANGLTDTARAYHVLQNWDEGAQDDAPGDASWNEWTAGTGWGAVGCNLAVPDGSPVYADSTWDRIYRQEDAVYVSATGDVLFRVDDAVQRWADGAYLPFGYPNYGVVIKMDTEVNDGDMNEFVSSEVGGATAPYLDVWYQVIPPVITGLDDAATALAVQYDSSRARFGFEVDDPNDDTVRAYMELERIGQGFISWDSLNGYTTGDTGWIDTSAAANDTMRLNFRAMWGAGVETVCVARMIVTDIRTNADTVLSDTFNVDTKDPSGLTALTASDSSGGTATLGWSVVTEGNFDHYEIRYSTSSGVNLSTPDVWDDGNDGNLATRTTNSTTVTGLTAGQAYYFKVWAYDAYGNYETVAERMVTLLAAPVVGWDPAGCVLALAPAAWSRGNGTADQTSGEFPGYPDGSYNATLTNMTAGYGYVYNGGSGYLGFDGSGDFVATAIAPTRTTASSETYELKINLNALPTNVLSQYEDGSNYFVVGITAGGQAAVIYNVGGISRSAYSVASVVGTGQLHTIHAVKDGADLKLYVDGTEVSYASQNTYDHADKAYAEGLVIGASDANGFAEFKGRCYWAAYYNVALNAGRIAANAAADSTMSGIGTSAGDVLAFTKELKAHQYNQNFVRLFYNATDADDATVTVTTEGKFPDAGSWTGWGAFKSFAEWDTGAVSTTPTGLDSIRWRMKSMLGTDQDTTYLLRVIATAPDGAADTGYTDAFKIDTKNPSGLASFACVGSSIVACTLAWDASGLVESNFDHYEIWYGTVLSEVNGRSGGALEWDDADDAALADAAEDTTVVTGLDIGTKYYFRIWAADSFGNEQALPADSISTRTSPVPSLKGWGGTTDLYADQFDTSRIYIGYQIDDSDDATVVVTAELKEPDAAGWADWDSLNGYTSGDTGAVAAAAGVNDTMVLDLRTMWGDQVDTTVIIRVIADDLDGATANDTLYADTIVVDTKDPVGLGASGLSVTAADTYSVTLGWSAVTDEGNFDHYEIWYDTLPGITRGAGEQEWDDGDDGALATMVTTSTEITGLLQKRHYYFKIWAVDSLGNDSTVAEVDTSTINTPPVVTGWSDAANVGARQTDTNTVRIRYEMDDFDDAQCTVRVELKRINEAGWTAWSGLRAYASGDTGVLDTAGATGRTAYLDIRSLLGTAQDTLALVRIIARDTVSADTTLSDTFVIDTRDPQGLANFILKDSTLTTVKAVWDTVTLEKNFDHYEIWLSSSKSEVLNRNGAAQEWDDADDDTLGFRGGDSTMITGLTYNTLFYFQAWAYDSLGNYARLGLDSLLTPTTAQAALTNTQVAGIRSDGGSALPEESSWNFGSSTTFSTGLANAGVNDPTFRGLIRTADLALLPQGATLDSAKLSVYCSGYSGTPDNLRIYRVIQNWVEGTASGTEQVGSVSWDSYGGGASWYRIGCDSSIANATAQDGGEADRTITPEDTQPVSAVAWITFNVSTAFQAWVDGYYGLSFGWDNNGVLIKQDDEVSVASNTFATDDDATNPPYFDVWYRVVPPALSGWDDAVYIDVEQYDTSSIRVGYEMLDENDGSTYVSIELHEVGQAWAGWDTVMDFASGDTGWVDTSATWNDTAIIDIRGLLGDVDGLYELRVIARDKRMNVDTLYSDVFDLDTKDPAGLSAVTASDSGETFVIINWSAVTESNFDQYKVYYDTVPGITEVDTVWDLNDDAALGTKATTTTTVTGLIPNRTYYFKVWAYDTLGNEASAGPESCHTLVGPVLSGLDDALFISAAQYDSSMVLIGFEVDDEDDDTIHIRADYKKSSAGSWTALANVTGDTGWVDTSVTANDTIKWNARAQLGVVDTFYLVRVIARDKDSLYDTLATDTFYVDTQDPQNLVNFRPTDEDTFAITLSWTPPVESRFDYYEIRYDSVAGITQADTLWDITDQPSLDLLATSTATVSGLERRTTYYFKLWAYDSLGNVTATQETSAATANVPPQVTGWADAGSVYAEQYDSSTIRVGYEFDDYDDAVGTLSVEIQMKGGSWLGWDSLNAYCSGDTGVVGTSATANDTILIDIRSMWGVLMDTTCLVRVIARDPQGGADTMASDTFVVDTRDPVGLSKVYPFTSDTFNVSVRWDTVTFDRNFDRYYLYYSGGAGVDRADSLWGAGSDAALDTVGTETTTVTGLAGKKRYYFRLYAEDSLGNVSASAETSYTTANMTPDISGFGGGAEAFALQYGEVNVRLGYELRDYDDSQVRVFMEGKKPADGSWTPWSTLQNFVYGDTGSVATSPTANDTVVWKMKSQYGPGIDTIYVMRIIGVDTAGAADTVLTDTFSIDTRKPLGMANLSVSDSTEVSATVVWDSVTAETNFDHYELWVGTSLSDVSSRGGSAVEWDNGDDVNLASAGTETTSVTGLTINTKYYVKIWAFDTFGNDTTVNADSFTTLTSNTPVVRGWNGATKVYGDMSDTSTVRLGYQVDDSDDGSVIVKFEIKRPADAGWVSFDSLDAYTVAGADTGTVTTSATANDTILLDVRTLLGNQVDTVYVARVIATDDALPTNNADTTLTDTFVVDTKDPVWVASKLEATANDTFSISLQWTGTPTETNFGHYEIWYDTLAGITRAAGEREWDDGDDAALANKATTTTTVTGLKAKKTYYFKIWAQDSLGNETALNDTFYATADIAPEVTGWDDAAAAYAKQVDSSVIRVGYQLDDYDDASDTVRVEMKMVDGPWMDWDSLNAYASGDTGVVAASAAANDTILVNGRTVWGSALDTLFLARVIAKDTSGKADTVASDTFVVDTKDPVWTDKLEPSGNDTFSVSLQWTGTPTETNFGHYEIWYDTLAGITRAAGEKEWDHGDDAALANKAITTTTVTGLLAKRTYYFKIWACDSLGNETALNDTFYATADVAPVVTGWGDVAYANARQYDSSRVRLGYEVDDYDDDSSLVTLEVQMTGGPWMDWDSLNAYVTGDTGTVAGSPTANDTVILYARTLWGPALDTTMVARFIAVDSSGLADTVASNPFVVDTKDPSWGGGALAVIDSSGDRVTISWDTVTAENNFSRYVIWYDTSKTNVAEKTGTADKYDPADNAAMNLRGTDTVIITGLYDDQQYFFQIWAYDNLGNFTVLPPESATTTTPSRRLNDIADAFIQDTVGFGGEEYFNNYGSAAYLRVGWRDALGAGANPKYRSLIKFTDVGDIPTGATIDSAFLRLQCNQSRANDTVRVYRILQDWNAGTANGTYQANAVSWDSIGNGDAWNGIGLSAAVANGAAAEDGVHDRTLTEEDKAYVSGTGAYSWDVTQAVSNWVTGTWSNYGLFLKQDTESGVDSVFNDFISGDGVGNTPYVDIYYRTLPPVVKGWDGADTMYTKQYDSSYARIGYQLTDKNDSNAYVSLQVRKKNGGWSAWSTVRSRVSGDTGWVDTSSVANDTILLNLRALYGAAVETTCQARLVAQDAKGNSDTLLSLNFVADTKDPTGLGGFTATGATQNSVTLSWNAVTEKNFGTYRIHYDTVAAVTQADSAWDNADDGNLEVRTTTNTTVSGLVNNKRYYFKLWAIDSLGNRSTVAEISRWTLSAPVVTGWSAAGTLYAGQYDSSRVRIGYELQDVDDESVHIAVEYKKADDAFWTALTGVTGDTGWIDTSATANDTVIWNARSQLGVVDTFYLVRVIATDDDGLRDTLRSDTIFIDTEAPQGLANFRPTGADTFSITLQWTPPTGARFSCYGIRYATSSGITLSDTLWDCDDDANLNTLGTAITTVTGLLGKTRYYFRMWAADSVGNAAVTQETSYVTTNVAPDLTGWGAGAALYATQYNTDSVRIGFEAGDYDDDSATVTLEGKKPADGGWTAWTSLNSTMYGDTGRVLSSTTANDTIIWDMFQYFGAGVDTYYVFRALAVDTAGGTDTLYSDTFAVDTKAPAGLDTLGGIDSTSVQVTLRWDTVTVENNFGHYEIWYDTLLANVTGRTGGALEWDNGDDANLAVRGTDTTVVTNLSMNTKYYYKIWAVDQFGNESTAVAAVESVSTLPSLVPVLEGWGGMSRISAYQLDTSVVRFGYQVDDFNDAQVGVTMELKKVGGAWTNWAGLKAYASGDTGTVNVSASANDTVELDVRALLGGSVDTLYLARFIADDGGNADTLVSDTFFIDTKDPAGGLTAVAPGDAGTNTITVTWDKITDEPRFWYYEVRYDTLASVTLDDAVWDTSDDTNLRYADTTSTTIAGLLSKHRYYFRVWAYDSLGNRFGSNEDDTSTVNAAPAVTGWGGGVRVSAVQQDSSLVRIGFELTDPDDNTDTARFEMKLVGGGWAGWDSLNAYAGGDTGAIAVSTADDTAYFDVRSALGAGLDTLALVRVIVADTGDLADTAVSDTFVIDTEDPAGMANFAITGTLATSITIGWDTVTAETHFDHYEVWVDTVKANVTGRSGGIEWDDGNNASLANAGTRFTSVSGLIADRLYYVKAWAVDAYGNEMSLPLDSVTTVVTDFIVLTDAVDAYIQSTVGFGGIEDSMNYGAATVLRVGWRDAVGFGDNPVYRSLLRFGDIDTIDPSAVIDSAYLLMYCSQNTFNDTVRLYRTLLDWNEGGSVASKEAGAVCWQDARFGSLGWNAPGAAATVPNASAVEDSSYDRAATAVAKAYVSGTGWVQWNITQIVQNWTKQYWANYGFVMKQDTESGADSVFNDFYSGNAGANRPYIKVWSSASASWRIAWWDKGELWGRRADLDLNTSGLDTVLTDFPLLVKLYEDRIDYDDFKNDGTDLRFLDENNSTLLDYHIEKWDTGGTSYVWVEVPQVNAGGTRDSVWMYYGNRQAADVQDTVGTWNSGFTGVWHLDEQMNDEQTFGSHYDATGNGYAGTQGGNDDVDAVIGSGQDFDGTNDYVSLGDEDAFSFGDGSGDTCFSVSAWVRMDDATDFIILNKYDNDEKASREWSFKVLASDYLYIGIYDESSNAYRYKYYSTPMTAFEGQWVHLGATYDGNPSGLRLYINGQRVDDNAGSGGSYTAMENLGEALYIGADVDAGYFADGMIDEVRLSAALRNSSWMLAEYRAGADLLIDWGAAVTDSQDNQPPDNDMTLTASFLPNTDKIALAWNPGVIDSSDADTVGIWYAFNSYPGGASDTFSTLLGYYAVSDSADTLVGQVAGSTYYFCLTVRDTGGLWADTAGSSCDTAFTAPGVLRVVGRSKVWGTVRADTQNVDIMQLLFIADKETIYVDSLTVELEGAGVDNGDVDTVALFSDAGGVANTMIPGAFSFFDSSGSRAWAILAPASPLVVPAGETLSVHIVYDITSAATVSKAYKVAIYDPDSIRARGKISGSGVQVVGTFPIKTGDITDWWGDGNNWGKRLEININTSGIDTVLTDFPLLVKLYENRINYDDFKDDGSDLRFLDEDNTTPIDYHIEKWDTSGTSYVWVEVPQISASPGLDSIWMYYENPSASDAQDTAGTWNGGFAGVWHLNESVTDEQTTGTHLDASGNGHDASQGGNDDLAAILAAGQDFDGTDDSVVIADHDDFSCGDGADDLPFSISAWVKMDDATNFVIANKYDDGPRLRREWSFKTLGSDHIYLGIYDESANAYYFRYRNAVMTAYEGQWIHLAAAYNGNESGTGLRIYLNGQRVDDNGGSGGTYTAMENLSEPVYIGADVTAGLHANGAIDEVRISSVWRDSNWVYAEYRSCIDSLLDWNNAAGDTHDIAPPDNDVTLDAAAVPNTDKIALSWNPGVIDSADADSVAIWYAFDAFPAGAYDSTGILAGRYVITDSSDTLSGLVAGSTYYFCLAVRDTGGFWSDTAGAACDTAYLLPGSLFVSGDVRSNGNADADSENVDMMVLHFAADRETVYVDSFTVTLLAASGVDISDVDTVALFYDAGGSPGSMIPGAFSFFDSAGSGAWTRLAPTTPLTVPAGETLSVHVLIDVSGTADGSEWFRLSVDNAESVWARGRLGGTQVGVTGAFPILSGDASLWWTDGNLWEKRFDINITNAGLDTVLTDFPLLVKLYDGRISYADFKSDGSDLRFLDEDNNTPLDYHIEAWNPSGTSYVWVEVPEISTAGTPDSIWMYYDNPLASDNQDTAGTWNGGFAGVWHLNESVTDEQATGTHLDASGNGHDASQGGNDDLAAILAAGQDFDGTDDSVVIADHDDFSYGNGTDDSPFSVSAWVRMDDATNFVIANKYDDGTDLRREWSFKTLGSDHIYLGIYDESANAYYFRYRNAVMTAYEGQWIHLAATYNGNESGTGLRIYLNGQRIDDNGSGGGTYTAMENLSEPVYIGADVTAGLHANGAIDEVRISSVWRDSNWVYAEYRSCIDSLLDWDGAVADTHPNYPPDNDVALSAAPGANKSILLSWTPGNIDSVDADSMAVWYKTGDYPDSAYDASATLLTKYGNIFVSADTLHYAVPGSTYYFMLFVRDSSGHWSDSSLSGGAYATAIDTMPPDNDISLTASALGCTTVALAWNPAPVDSSDADSVAVWFKTGDYPDSADDASAAFGAAFPLSATAGTLAVPFPGSEVYFALLVRDSSGNWSDTLLSACDTAATAPGTLTVYGSAQSPGTVHPGSTDVDLLLLKFYAPHETVYVDTIILHVENTADTFDLDTVAVFSDNGGTADTMIPGAFAYAESLGSEIVAVVVPSDSLIVPRGETLKVHIVIDVAAGANADHIVTLSINAADSVRARGKYSATAVVITGSYPMQSGDVTLPVELASFTAQQAGAAVQLAWQTASETDNLGYHVYRSRWQEGPYARLNADLISGAVNSETGNSYAFTDSTLRSAGTYWYKLSDVDIAGVQTYHGPLAVAFAPPGAAAAAAEKKLVLYGNPLSAGSVLRFRTAARGVTRIVIYDDEGLRINDLRYEQAGAAGPVQITGSRLMDMLGRREGIYFVELHTQDAVERVRILYLQ